MRLVGDQFALSSTWASERPRLNMPEEAADLTLCALYEVVSTPARAMAVSSHLASVDGVTGWKGLVFAMNSLLGRQPSAAL